MPAPSFHYGSDGPETLPAKAHDDTTLHWHAECGEVPYMPGEASAGANTAKPPINKPRGNGEMDQSSSYCGVPSRCRASSLRGCSFAGVGGSSEAGNAVERRARRLVLLSLTVSLPELCSRGGAILRAVSNKHRPWRVARTARIRDKWAVSVSLSCRCLSLIDRGTVK